MEKRTDSNLYTILFAIVMVIVVGTLLAFSDGALKPTINENKRIEKQQNILYAMGINENEDGAVIFVGKDNIANEFSKYIKKQLVIQGDKIEEDDKAYLIDIKKEQTIGKKDPSKRRLPVFIGEKDGKTIYIVPVRGKGLWDAIWGYVAMDSQMVVQGVYFDHKGETPGLGANIKQRFFMDDFAGEHTMKNGVFKGISAIKGNADPKNEDKTDNEVDALAGATITSSGVSAMLKSELKLYVPYFKNLKTN